jgi:hypothetical protein
LGNYPDMLLVVNVRRKLVLDDAEISRAASGFQSGNHGIYTRVLSCSDNMGHILCATLTSARSPDGYIRHVFYGFLQ